MKGVISIYRILKKLLMFLVLLIFSSSLFVLTSSYSIAEIKSNAEISITNSENALIGIASIINGGSIQKVISRELMSYLPVSGDIPVVIKNNMNTMISVTCNISGNNSDIFLEINERTNPVEIGPGNCGVISFIAIANPETSGGIKTMDLTFEADWNGGNAVIESQINIEVIEPELVDNNSKANISSYVTEFHGNPLHMEYVGVKDNQSSIYKNDQKSNNQTWIGILHQQHTMVESKEIANTDEIMSYDNQNEIDREKNGEKYEKSIADLYQRCIGLSTHIENAIEEININEGQFNNYKGGMNLKQKTVDKSKLVELHEKYSKLYFELQVLINNISNIVKGENVINDSDILNISQRIENIEINNELLHQKYIGLLTR
jgi:hypothetical protein